MPPVTCPVEEEEEEVLVRLRWSPTAKVSEEADFERLRATENLR